MILNVIVTGLALIDYGWECIAILKIWSCGHSRKHTYSIETENAIQYGQHIFQIFHILTRLVASVSTEAQHHLTDIGTTPLHHLITMSSFMADNTMRWYM